MSTNENPPARRGQHALERELEVAAVGARLRRVLVGDELGDERGVGGGVELGRRRARSPGSMPSCSASSTVLVRLPLCPSAKPASPTER